VCRTKPTREHLVLTQELHPQISIPSWCTESGIWRVIGARSCCGSLFCLSVCLYVCFGNNSS
jgi:hypothetical protein